MRSIDIWHVFHLFQGSIRFELCLSPQWKRVDEIFAHHRCSSPQKKTVLRCHCCSLLIYSVKSTDDRRSTLKIAKATSCGKWKMKNENEGWSVYLRTCWVDLVNHVHSLFVLRQVILLMEWRMTICCSVELKVAWLRLLPNRLRLPPSPRLETIRDHLAHGT